MKKSLIVASMIGVSLLLGTNVSAKEDSVKKVEIKKDSVKNKIENTFVFKQIGLKVKSVNEISGIYAVTVQTRTGAMSKVYITKDLKIMIHSGKAMELSTGADLKKKINLDSIKSLEPSLTIGHGKKVLYVFSDPECPWCKRFHEKFSNKLDKYTIKMFLMPLTSLHPNAVEKSHWILGGKDDKEKLERMTKGFEGSKEYRGYLKQESLEDYKKVENLLKKYSEVERENEITGTPTVIDEDGNRVKNWLKL